MTATALVPGISAAELDVTQAAAGAFLARQGTARRDSYHWPPEGAHYMDPDVSEPSAAPAGIPADAMEVIRQAGAEFLASQGTGHRTIYDWPQPHDQHGHMMVDV